MFALVAIRDIGGHFSCLICQGCGINLGEGPWELMTDGGSMAVAVISGPLQFRIPSWMLIRQRGVKDGKASL